MDSLVVVVPKVLHPETLSQFRPISLCMVIYKLITKIIVNRLKPVLTDLIAHFQSSFVPGRQITDNVVVVQEVIHTMRLRKVGKVL